MKMWRGLVVGAVLLVTLTGCTAPAEPEPDTAELNEWIGAWDERIPNSLGTVAGLATKESEAQPGEGVTLDLFGDGVSTVEFSCFGVESMSADFTIEQGPVSITNREEELACEDSPHVLGEDIPEVTAVVGNGISATGSGAWAVVVRKQK